MEIDIPAIVCEGLCKRFGNRTALDHLNLSVPQGTDRIDIRLREAGDLGHHLATGT